MSTPESRPFQVELRGIVDLLSRSIYSGPRVFLRELLQNGQDALSARREHDGGGTGIRITPVSAASDVFRLQDDGIGLDAAEVGELLSTVGRSSKRDLFDLPRTDRLGQFGIGLLSCFMVVDEIVVRSRSARGGDPVEWVGRSDGTFTVRPLQGDEADAVSTGSVVELRPRPGDVGLLGTATAIELAAEYGRYLPTPIRVDLPGGGEERINREPLFAEPFTRPSDALLELGRELIGAQPLDAIPLSVPGTQTRGTAFVLPFAPAPGARQAHRVHLGGMLLSERMDDLLPDWSFFVRCVIDTKGLHPTASREALIEDDALEQTRAELGDALRRWVIGLAATSPGRLAEFLAVHHQALRSLALHDEELAAFIVPHLAIETSNGVTTFGDLARKGGVIRFAETVDEFRQIAGIAAADDPVVNGGYVYDAELLRRLPESIPGSIVQRVTVADELDNLAEPPLEQRETVRRLEERAAAALADLDCSAAVRAFDPADHTALYVADPEVLRGLEREKARDAGGGFWGDMMGKLDAAAQQRSAASALGRLCLNWRNPLVRTLADLDDDVVFVRTVRILYVQSLLAGHRPLRAADRAALTQAMTDIVQLSVASASDRIQGESA